MRNLTILLLVCFALVGSSLSTSAQVTSPESFEIKKNNATVDVATYSAALQSANLDKYRLVDQRRILKFASGLEVELLSSNELNAKGISFDPRRICTTDVPVIHPAVFGINANGHIIEGHQTDTKESPKKIK